MSAKKKTVIQVDVNCEKCQTEIFAKVGKINGISSMSVDEKKKTVTVTGTVEPAALVKALKKVKTLKKKPEILTVGPTKPKCPECQYLQGVCTCGMGTTSNFSNYPYLPQQPYYESYNYQPPPPPYYPSSSYYWPTNTRQCELNIVYPPEYDTQGSCSIV